MDPKTYSSFYPDDDKYNSLVDFLLFIPDKDFAKVLKYISETTGYSDGIIGIFYSNSFEKWEEDYFESGVMVYLNESEVIVCNEVFQKYIAIAVDIYLEKHNNDEKEIFDLLRRIQEINFDQLE